LSVSSDSSINRNRTENPNRKSRVFPVGLKAKTLRMVYEIRRRYHTKYMLEEVIIKS